MTDRASRLDAALVERGLARSRGEARDLVESGAVVVGGLRSPKPSSPVTADSTITVGVRPRWVGRAAYKLVEALEAFGPAGLVVEGRRCIDVGASTGGFTQVLLAHGACEVVALDVGHGQLAAELADDPRVRERSGTNVRDVTAADLGGTAGVVVADLSFISLRLVLPGLRALLDRDGDSGGDLVVLVKPQFEVGRGALGKAGVVRSAKERLRVLREVVEAARADGLAVAGVMPSPIRGGRGNAEYLLWCTVRYGGGLTPEAVDLAVEQTVGGSA